MKTIKFNGYLLPNVGANIDGAPKEEKKEYLRLIQKAYGGDYLFAGAAPYYGIPKENPSLYISYFKHLGSAGEESYEILPLPLATTWLKVALGEITRENWVVDIEAEKDHERLHEFKMWLNRKRSFSFIFNDRFYGIINGLPRSVNAEDRPDVINLDMFFTYFYEQEAELLPDHAEPVNDRWIELTGTPKEAPNVDLWMLSNEGEVFFTPQDSFVEVGTCTHYMIAQKPLPPPMQSPEKLAREQAEKKAVQFLETVDKSVKYDTIAALTEYILKEKM